MAERPRPPVAVLTDDRTRGVFFVDDAGTIKEVVVRDATTPFPADFC